MVTKSCRAWRLALGGKRWTFIMLLSAPSQCKPISCQNFQNGQDLLCVRMCQLLWRQRDRTLIPSLSDGLVVDMFCKDCQVVQDESEGVPWKTEQKKRDDKDWKKRSWSNQTKTSARASFAIESCIVEGPLRDVCYCVRSLFLKGPLVERWQQVCDRSQRTWRSPGVTFCRLIARAFALLKWAPWSGAETGAAVELCAVWATWGLRGTTPPTRGRLY